MKEEKHQMIVLPCVGSTNDELKKMARGGAPHGTVLVAKRQTNGRGRLGRSFASPEKGLYMSVLLQPDGPAEKLPTLTPCAALAVRRALRRVCGTETDIKWPNDLLVNGKKLCGILTEGVVDMHGVAAVVGIGINVNTDEEELPQELSGTVCSVLGTTGRETDIMALASAVTEELEKIVALWETDDPALLEEYRAACVSLGRDCYILRGEERVSACVRAVADDFSLVVDTPSGVERVFFGELVFA